MESGSHCVTLSTLRRLVSVMVVFVCKVGERCVVEMKHMKITRFMLTSIIKVKAVRSSTWKVVYYSCKYMDRYTNGRALVEACVRNFHHMIPALLQLGKYVHPMPHAFT